MNGRGGWRKRRLFASPTRRRSLPDWAWTPFAGLAAALGGAAGLRALGVDGPGWFRWLTDPRQALVPAVFLLSIVAAAALYGRVRNSPGRVIGVLTVSAFAVFALLLGIASYIHCAPGGPPFFEPLIWVLSGNGAEPWGAGPGCPAQPPLAHHLARLCALWGALASVLGVVAAMLRRQIDRWLAVWSRRSAVVLGASSQAGALVRLLAATRAPGTSVVVVESTGDEALISTVRTLGARVIAAEAVDAELLTALVTSRGRTSAESVHIVEERVPEALATFGRVARALDEAAPDEAVVPRVLVRIDDPWAAENWRRSTVVPNRSWLADALSATEQTARAVVARIELVGAQRLVLAGAGELAAAVLAEVARRGRERRVLRADEPDVLAVTLVGAGAQALADEHEAQQRRFGNDPGIGRLRVVTEAASDQVLVTAAGGGPATLLVIAAAEPGLNRPTRLAGRLPEVTILAVDPASTELPDQALVGRLTSFGVGLLTSGELPEDHWTRIARLLHTTYLAQLGEAAGERPSTRPWDVLPAFYRASNLRQVHSLFSGVAQLGRTWAGDGSEEELSPAEIDYLSRREHDSWRRFYLANGWRQGAERNDDRLVHNWLVEWDALPPPARARTSAGVRRALALLDTAGYRSRRETRLVPFRRRGRVTARRLTAPLAWSTEAGDRMQASAGDWLVTDPHSGRRWTADPQAFALGHEPLGGDCYRRTGLVHARPAHLAEAVQTLEGPATAKPGDWLVEGDLQERWLVPADRFAEAYEPV